MSDSSDSTASRRSNVKLCSPTGTAKRVIASKRSAVLRGTIKAKAHAEGRKGPAKLLSLVKAIPPERPEVQSPRTESGPSLDTPETQGSSSASSREFLSAAETPLHSPINLELSTRKRRGSEGDLSPSTSTPESRKEFDIMTDRPRSDSSLLRIRAQIRAASALEVDKSIRNIEEPAETEECHESLISEISSVGGGALHEMPRLANALLQKTKGKLEESRNLSREIRESVVSGMHGLHEMVLRLADSRNRHIADKEKQRASYERRLVQSETKHAANLQALATSHREAYDTLLNTMKASHKEIEATRWLTLDIERQIQDNAKIITNLVHKQASSVGGVNTQDTNTLQEDIAMLRLELGTFNVGTCAGSSSHVAGTADPAITAADIKEIKQGLENLRQDTHSEAPRKSYSEAARVTPKARMTSTTDGTSGLTPARLGRENAVPHYPIMVESVDPRDCGEDIIKKIKSTVDVVALGVGVNSVRKLKNQKVLISCDSEKDRTALGQAIKNSGEILTISTPTPKNPLIKLLAVAQDLDDRKLEEAILKQNPNLLQTSVTAKLSKVRVIRRTKSRNSALCNVVLEVDPQLWKAMVDQKIRLGYQLVRAVDQTPVVQCYNCLGFGHRAAECRSHTKCGHCAGNHDTRKCDNRNGPAKCVNCPTYNNHPAYSQSCPEWQRWDRIARHTVSYC